MPTFDSIEACREGAPRLMAELIDTKGATVPDRTVIGFHCRVLRLGFDFIGNQAFGPPGGRQLFYRLGLLVARAKTRGDEKGPRAGQPHLSVALTDGKGDAWFNDLAKLNAAGQFAAKSLTTAERFNPTDFQGNPQRFVVIQGGQYDGAGGDAWANRTHFPFPSGFDDAGAGTLR